MGTIGNSLLASCRFFISLLCYCFQTLSEHVLFENLGRRDWRRTEKIFSGSCAGCHTPPLYTNNKLLPAPGFTAPDDHKKKYDVMPVESGTDPGLTLSTRRGTGYYKVPSLRGVWYRGHYLHDGSAASLEEMFDPDRLKETHVRGGWTPPGAKTHAIQGHEFGLKLEPNEREQLIAFLRTL